MAKKTSKAPKAEKLAEKAPAAAETHPHYVEALQEHMSRGLEFTVDGDNWNMAYNGKTDSGHTTMPAETVRLCADKLMGIGG